ncbi:hypothetical protein LTR36_000760 [Oleoguttula mirabilis]|uniref:Uncharacterized protein n=1 Tax=Oleoguttula mirabilis TaxID=1507867 RepID=A0AAV9JQV5_9PEZI|nr:hypothetical protein LTR36_000760 [Oleoguttula mirabilis]
MQPTIIFTAIAAVAISISNVAAFPMLDKTDAPTTDTAPWEVGKITRGQQHVPYGGEAKAADQPSVDVSISPSVTPTSSSEPETHDLNPPTLQKRHCKIHWYSERFCTPDGHKRDVAAIDEDNVNIPGRHSIPGLSPTLHEAVVSAENAGHQYINVIMHQLEPLVRAKSFVMESLGLDTSPCMESCKADASSHDCRECATVFLDDMRFGMEAL